MTSEHSQSTPTGRRRRRSTEEITTLIDWALGDTIVDPAVEDELTRAARLMRVSECQEIRRRAA